MALSKASGKSVVYWKTQKPIDYIDTTLVINTWETVSTNLSGGKPASLLNIAVEQTNNGATQETIELEITINGTAYTITFTNIDSGVVNYCLVLSNLVAGDFTFLTTTTPYATGSPGRDANWSTPFIASKVGLIRVRQTSTVDATAAQIEVNIAYSKLVGV